MTRLIQGLTLVAVVAIAFLAGTRFGAHDGAEASVLSTLGLASAKPPADVDFTPLWRAWQQLENKYIPATTSAEITAEDRLWGAIQGLADSYGDPYTVFLPPVETEMFEEDISGQFGGVGMEVGKRDNLLTVIAPLKDTPAAAAGLLAGDRIIEIEGESTKNMSIDQAIRIIRGEVGTDVTLTVFRESTDDVIEVVITRAIINIPTARTELRADGVFVVELYNFGATSPNEFRRAIREFILSGSTELIIDLRGNPGGFLEASVDVASWFLPMGKVVVKEKFGSEERETLHRSRGYDVHKDHWEVVILINGGSASASEIVAGALSEHGVATLIGERTFGKGSVQELVDITADTALKVTIARWLTPNGVSISDNGLAPDVEVPMSIEDYQAGRDPQLEKAVEFLLNDGVLPVEPEADLATTSPSN